MRCSGNSRLPPRYPVVLVHLVGPGACLSATARPPDAGVCVVVLFMNPCFACCLLSKRARRTFQMSSGLLATRARPFFGLPGCRSGPATMCVRIRYHLNRSSAPRGGFTFFPFSCTGNSQGRCGGLALVRKWLCATWPWRLLSISACPCDGSVNFRNSRVSRCFSVSRAFAGPSWRPGCSSHSPTRAWLHRSPFVHRGPEAMFLHLVLCRWMDCPIVVGTLGHYPQLVPEVARSCVAGQYKSNQII